MTSQNKLKYVYMYFFGAPMFSGDEKNCISVVKNGIYLQFRNKSDFQLDSMGLRNEIQPWALFFTVSYLLETQQTERWPRDIVSDIKRNRK